MIRILIVVVASASALIPAKSKAIEASFPCVSLAEYGYNDDMPFPSSVAAPQRIATVVYQDYNSRYVSSLVSWSSISSQLMAGFRRTGFEFEVIFYNYDDAISLGFGAAYILDAGGSWRCDIPNCYLDTQLGGAKNSYGEYQEVNIAIGSFDVSSSTGTPLTPYRLYGYGTRGTTGRSNFSLMKLNYQTAAQGIPGVPSNLNMLRCSNSSDHSQLRFEQRVFVPICIQNFNIEFSPTLTIGWKNCDPGFVL